MLLRYFYNPKLSHASYLIGCQATGEAIVIDPGRDLTPYLEAAKEEGLTLTAAAETHIHADFVSGARELGKRYNTMLYLSGEGDASYAYIHEEKHTLLKNNDTFHIGNLTFQAVHTPGHTPEHLSYILTDGGASEPIGIFTGDFVFVGDVGRPDLLETAVGQSGAAKEGAQQMFASVQRIKELPDYMQVWPGHGAGSACGKALGAIPSTTIGYEKRFNHSFSIEDENAFVQTLLEGQPETPAYFSVMKHVNKEGPTLLSELKRPEEVEASKPFLTERMDGQAVLLDVRSAHEFATAHIPGTINIPYNRSFTNWAGWLLPYDQDIYVIADSDVHDSLLTDLYSIGLDRIAGFIRPTVLREYKELQSYEEKTPEEMAERVQQGDVHVLDVRNQSEWESGHIPQAQHIMLGYLPKRMDELPVDKTILLHCQSGARSAIATSLLQAHGFTNVINLAGGFSEWSKQKLPQDNQ
ncbi:MBL fold metallo-hydrolase [Aneurinibacillus sp. REN35]|uniref:MBL fold metallo-hydrolase n=1 Tax=Aneurinibacillus sp. REN35 TaxID=3237286 RepID=UPI003528D1C4